VGGDLPGGSRVEHVPRVDRLETGSAHPIECWRWMS
jgi:hypothetical protein